MGWLVGKEGGRSGLGRRGEREEEGGRVERVEGRQERSYRGEHILFWFFFSTMQQKTKTTRQ